MAATLIGAILGAALGTLSTVVAGQSAGSLLLAGLAAAAAGGFAAALLAPDKEALHSGACGVVLALLYGVVWPRVGNLDPTNSLALTALPGSLLGALVCRVASRPATQRFWSSTSRIAGAAPGRLFWVLDKLATLLDDKARRRLPETDDRLRARGDSPVRRALREQRRVLLDGEIDDATANLVIAEMLFLEDQDPAGPLELLIDSPGGAFVAAIAVADTLRGLRCPVPTSCLGRAGGMAAILLALGRKGERTIVERGEVVLTEPDTERGRPPRDAAEREALSRAVATCERLLTEASGGGASLRRLRPLPRRLSPQEAIRLGIVDRIRPAAELRTPDRA